MVTMPPGPLMTPEVASPHVPSCPIVDKGRYEGNVSQAFPVQKKDSKETTGQWVHACSQHLELVFSVFPSRLLMVHRGGGA